MAEESENYMDAEFTGNEAANIELRMIGGQPLKGGPYVMGNNASARRVRVHRDDWALLQGTGLLKEAAAETQPNEQQQQSDQDNSAAVDMLGRTGISQETATKLIEAGYTTPDALRTATDEQLGEVVTDKRELRTLRQAVGK